MKALISDDGILRQEYIKEDDHKFIVKTTQDYEPILKANEQSRLFGSDFSTKKPMYRVASIPLSMVNSLMKKGIWNDPQAMRAWLDNPENIAFRTDRGTRKLGSPKRVVYEQSNEILVNT